MAGDTEPSGTVVFRSKLTVPPGRGLMRSRLLGALDGIWRGQLGLVVAPAGSGKTTLAAQYARSRVEATAWLRAERADGHPDRLLGHLSHAVSGALGVPPRPDGGLDGILLALERWSGERALVVVDDVHALDGTPALAALHRLATLTPPAVRFLAVGRSEPAGLDLSRQRLSEELCEIAADDLRFRTWEIERLFREVYGHPLPPETVDQVANRTGGWAAGLQLLHLAANPAAPANAAGRGVLDLVARSHLLGSYLVANVLDELPPELLAFVRDTAALGLLTGDLCDGVRGGSGSQPVLEELERRQICRPVRGGYRYLPLLQAHLDTDLRRRQDGAGAAEYLRAARLLERAGAYADALRAYAAAAEWAETSRLLRRHGERVVADGRSVRWDDVLPAGLLGDDPWLLLDAARRQAAAGRLHPAADLYERAERAARESRVRTVARRERAAVLAWSAAAPPASEWYAALWRATRARPLAAGDHASGRPAGDSSGWLVDGLAALLAGHASDADARLAGPATAAASSSPIVFLAARLGRLTARLCLGVRPTSEALEAIAVQADFYDLPWFARLARALLALTGGTDGRSEAESVLRDCARDGDDWGALLAGLVETCRRLADGSDPEEVAERCVLLARRLGAGVLECWARSLLALGLARGDRSEAGQAARGAEAAARNAEVPGARAVALVALSLCAGPGARRQETAALAAALLAECGLPASSPLAAGLLPPAVGSAPVRPTGATQAGRRRQSTVPVELRCFGGFRLRVQGVEPDWHCVRPRARATLRLLALHAGKPVHRETLLDALWPDKPAESARHGLQVAVSALRGLLEPESPRRASRWVIRDGDAYLLVLPPGSWQDVQDFTRARQQWRRLRGGGDPAAEAAALRRALAAYGGDLLPEDGPAEWVVAERERLRMEAAECATVLGQLELSAGRPAAAAEALERAVRIDPFRDTAWRSLCDSYGAVGDMAAAARARREYARLLTDLDLPGPPVSAP